MWYTKEIQMTTKLCNTCRLRDSSRQICLLTGQAVKNDDYCSKHTTDSETCALCGNIVISPIYTQNGEKWIPLCQECASVGLNHCYFCEKAQECDFETNPSSLPKYIQKQVRQGNMISIVTVKNPSRIEITCQKNCSCFDPNLDCMKQFNYCNNIHHIYSQQKDEVEMEET